MGRLTFGLLLVYFLFQARLESLGVFGARANVARSVGFDRAMLKRLELQSL